LCQRTARTVLRRYEATTTQIVERHAKAAGAMGDILDRLRGAASLPKDDRELIAELAPDIMAELNLNPRRAALYIAAGVMGLHVTNVWLVVEELKRMKAPPPAPLTPAAKAVSDQAQGPAPLKFPSQDTKAAVGNPIDTERKADLAKLRK